MISILVSGVAWYVTGADDAYVLPAETVVRLPRLVAAAATGRIAHLLVPEGTLDLRRRALPVAPVPVDRIFPIGAAQVPWSPDPARWQVGTDIPILSRNWHHLFRERDLFTPWGDATDRAALEAWQRRFGPRPTFREGTDPRTIRFKYPQLVDPVICYRLNEGFARLPHTAPFAPVAAVQERLRLVGIGEERVVVFGPGEFGWVARAFQNPADAGVGRVADSATPRSLDELERFIAPLGRFWRLEPVRREANLILPGGGL